jgi:hypothetical protein
MDEKPTGNTGPDSGEQHSEYHNWHEERRAWRNEMREKRWRQPWQGLFWGLLLVLLGILFLADQQGWLTGDEWWHYLLVGLGGVFIIDGLAHLAAGHHPYSFGRFIPGIVLLFVGLAFILGFSAWWPVILIAVGAGILLSFIFRRQ